MGPDAPLGSNPRILHGSQRGKFLPLSSLWVSIQGQQLNLLFRWTTCHALISLIRLLGFIHLLSFL